MFYLNRDVVFNILLFISEEKTPREKTSSPLPAIPTSTTKEPEKIVTPNVPVVIVMG